MPYDDDVEIAYEKSCRNLRDPGELADEKYDSFIQERLDQKLITGYDYQTEKHYLFTEDGSRNFLKVRDRVQICLKECGAVRMQEAIRVIGGGDWSRMACMDRLVELGEIIELKIEGYVPGQYRTFVSAKYE